MKSTTAALIDEIRSLSQNHERARRREEELRAARDSAILDAVDGGIPERTVAAAAGLRRGRIWQMKERRARNNG